jgi:hypothetical protein
MGLSKGGRRIPRKRTFLVDLCEEKEAAETVRERSGPGCTWGGAS